MASHVLFRGQETIRFRIKQQKCSNWLLPQQFESKQRVLQMWKHVLLQHNKYKAVEMCVWVSAVQVVRPGCTLISQDRRNQNSNLVKFVGIFLHQRSQARNTAAQAYIWLGGWQNTFPDDLNISKFLALVSVAPCCISKCTPKHSNVSHVVSTGFLECGFHMRSNDQLTSVFDPEILICYWFLAVVGHFWSCGSHIGKLMIIWHLFWSKYWFVVDCQRRIGPMWADILLHYQINDHLRTWSWAACIDWLLIFCSGSIVAWFVDPGEQQVNFLSLETNIFWTNNSLGKHNARTLDLFLILVL